MNNKLQAAFAQIHADDALIRKTTAYLHREVGYRCFKPKKFAVRGLAAAVLLIIITAGIFGLYFTADAHVSIDVNPSVELTLNPFNIVIDTHAFNEDGAVILNRLKLHGRQYDAAVELIISTFEADGYLSDEALVSMTVQAANSDKEQNLYLSLRKYIESLSAAMVETEIYPVTAEIWDDAHNCGVSPAKYLAIRELMEVDEEATIDAYSDAGIGQIRRRAQECRDGHHTESGGGHTALEEPNGHGHGHK